MNKASPQDGSRRFGKYRDVFVMAGALLCGVTVAKVFSLTSACSFVADVISRRFAFPETKLAISLMLGVAVSSPILLFAFLSLRVTSNGYKEGNPTKLTS